MSASGAGGFRRFRVAEKVPESANVTSFHLVPADGQPMWPARPGQYLTLRVPGAAGDVLRTYSISTDATRTDGTRITVKREPPPHATPGAPHGVGSGWLHDNVDAGTEIDIAAPRGGFRLDRDSDRPVVLLSGGVGQTPLLSMLHSLARSERQAWYLHACENGEVHAMRDEVDTLVDGASGRLHHHVVYRSPTEADRASARCDGEGLITKDVLQSLLPIDDYDCYLCGPTAFMVAQYRLLTSLGVAPGRIAYEFFGEGASLAVLAREQAAAEAGADAGFDSPRAGPGSRAPAALAGLAHLTDPEARAASDDDARPASAAASVRRRAEAGARPGPIPTSTTKTTIPITETVSRPTDRTVLFARSGIEARWSDDEVSLLELAERAGLAPAFSCRSGICNTCLCTVREGAVEYFEEPLLPPAPGTALLCCSRPTGRVVLEV